MADLTRIITLYLTIWLQFPVTRTLNTNSTNTFRGQETCGDEIHGTTNETFHFYKFTVNYPSVVNFDSCYSSSDIQLFIYDKFWNDISSTYCQNGNECGICPNGALAENFIIPYMEPESTYFIKIKTQSESGSYQIKIRCSEYIEPITFRGSVSCNETITDSFDQLQSVHWYYVHATDWHRLDLNTCNTNNSFLYITVLYFHPWRVESLRGTDMLINTWCMNCGSCNMPFVSRQQKPRLPIVDEDLQYMIGIQPHPYSDKTIQSYTVNVNCPLSISNYAAVTTETSMTMRTAEILCEQLYGTTLGTVITIGNFNKAYKVLMNDYHSIDVPAWTGAYKDTLYRLYEWDNDTMFGNLWPWVDDNYLNWWMSTGSYDETTMGLTLRANSQNFWYEEISASSNSVKTALCNAPDGTYPIPEGCNDILNCWFVPADDIFNDEKEFATFFVFWKWREIRVWINQRDILIDRGDKYIAYIYSNHTYATISYNRAVQYETSLYMYFSYSNNAEIFKFEILQIDLVSLEINNFTIPISAKHHVDFCVAVDAENIYLLGLSSMMIYNLKSHQWEDSINVWSDTITACVIDGSSEFIYIFETNQDKIYKYNIELQYIRIISEPNLCSSGSSSAIRARNGKAYLHGCYIGSWKTLIFNMDLERFEGISKMAAIETNDIPYYQSAILSIYDDNAIYMTYIIGTQYPIYNVSQKMVATKSRVLITDYISINLEQTIQTTWPSNEIMIKYYFINYIINTLNQQHYVWFNSSTQTQNKISKLLLLDPINDGCICDERTLKCYNCSQMFGLNRFLTTNDNHLDELKFVVDAVKVLMPMGSYVQPLIATKEIKITLQRCTLTFAKVLQPSNSDSPMISIPYSLSGLCHQRIDMRFSMSLHITSTSRTINIEKQVNILIVKNNEHHCQICSFEVENDCLDCNDSFIILEHDIIKFDETLNISFKSNMIDVAINQPDPFTSPYYFLLHEKMQILKLWQKYLIAIVSVLVALIIGIIITLFYRRNKRLAQQLEIQTKNTYYISNPLVLVITVGIYDKNPTDAGVEMHCNDIDVDIDYRNIRKMCKLFNYDIYPQEVDLCWSQDKIIQFMEQNAERASLNIDTLNEDVTMENRITNGYDSIMVFVSGHGYDNNIISSDYQLVQKAAIHRLMSANYSELRHLPRIFFYDVCDGDLERSHYPAESEQATDVIPESIPLKTEQGKNFDCDDIKLIKETSIWKSDQLNPDFKLSCIHAANPGFRAKLNTIDGSYLIYEYVKRMIIMVEENKNIFFGEIIDNIQTDLHAKGKQQIEAVFNNNTRYLRFKQNNARCGHVEIEEEMIA